MAWHNLNMRKVNLVGKKFNKWTVISESTKAKTSHDRVWECRCDCGNVSRVKTYYLTKAYSTQCVTCGQQPKPYTSELGEAFWRRIVRGATKRGYKVQVTRQEALAMFIAQGRKCALTGLEIKLPRYDTDVRDKKVSASLDRVDSTKDYVSANIQWVHKTINLMKNRLKESEFIEFCKLVARKHA